MSFGGRRLAYDRTDDPKIIDIISFVADEVSVTMVPAMSETIVTTAGQKEDLQKSVETKKDFAMQMQKMKLDKIKLSMLKPSRVFG
jgi:phage head maturation protease